MTKATRLTRKCLICRHPERVRIEMARLSGASLDAVGAKFSVSRDMVWRHMRDHVSDDRRAMLIADVPLKELAERAAAEGVSLIDHLAIIRSTLMNQLLAAAGTNDRHATAVLAGRALDVLREIGKLTGEIIRLAPAGHVTNNTLVLMSSPAMVSLERMLLERLQPHPDALRAVLEGLQALAGPTSSMPSAAALTAPETIDACAA